MYFGQGNWRNEMTQLLEEDRDVIEESIKEN